MHRFRSEIAAIVLASVLAGCGGSTVDEGSKGFTPTDTKPLEPLADQMKDVMKKKDYTKKMNPPAEKKEAEKKK